MVKEPHLHVLYYPTTCRPDLDIVFVHGINGDAFKSWENTDTKKVWPRDLFPQMRPATRVMSYGYNADIDNVKSYCRIRDHARTLIVRLTARRKDDPQRALILVGHCLGGLVVKQVLNLAKNERGKYGPIMTATCGAFFFGTPHLGTEERQLEIIAQYFAPTPADKSPPLPRGGGLLGRFRRQPLQPQAQTAQPAMSLLVKSIDKRANDPVDIGENFKHLTDWYYIANWTEKRSLPNVETLVVSENSGTMFYQAMERLTVEADHFNMCRSGFGSLEAGTFEDFMIQVDKALESGYNGPSLSTTGDIQGVKLNKPEPAVHTASRSPGGMQLEMQRAPANPNTQSVGGRGTGGPISVGFVPVVFQAKYPSYMGDGLWAALNPGADEVNAELPRLQENNAARGPTQSPWSETLGRETLTSRAGF